MTCLLATRVESGLREPDGTWHWEARPSRHPNTPASASLWSAFASPWWRIVLNILTCVYFSSIHLIWRSLFRTSTHWWIRLWGFFTYSGHKYFIKCMIWKYLLSICSWPYFPLECFLKIRCSYFWSDLIYLYFYGLYIGITSNSNSNCKIIPYFHLEILEFSIFHLGVWSF